MDTVRELKTRVMENLKSDYGIALYGEMPLRFEYFDCSCRYDEDPPVPEGNWCVFLVPGGSEGYYLHIECQRFPRREHPRPEVVFLGKCFDIDIGLQVLGPLVRMFDDTRPQTCVLTE